MSRMEELLNDELFVKKLSEKKNYDEVIALFLEYGEEISKEDVDDLAGAINFYRENKDKELSEDDLEGVSGGWSWFKYKCTCGRKFRSESLASAHALWKSFRNEVVCGSGGFTFCDPDGHYHTITAY